MSSCMSSASCISSGTPKGSRSAAGGSPRATLSVSEVPAREPFSACQVRLDFKIAQVGLLKGPNGSNNSKLYITDLGVNSKNEGSTACCIDTGASSGSQHCNGLTLLSLLCGQQSHIVAVLTAQTKGAGTMSDVLEAFLAAGSKPYGTASCLCTGSHRRILRKQA